MTPLILGLALTIAAPAPKKADEAPPAKLEGEWLAESIEGRNDGPPGDVRFTFTDAKISIKEGARDQPEWAGYTLDLSKKPAQIDIRPGNVKDKVVQGIIEVKGDTVRLCFGKEADRPTEFKGDAGK